MVRPGRLVARQAGPHSRIRFATGSVAMDRNESALLGLRADTLVVQRRRRVARRRTCDGRVVAPARDGIAIFRSQGLAARCCLRLLFGVLTRPADGHRHCDRGIGFRRRCGPWRGWHPAQRSPREHRRPGGRSDACGRRPPPQRSGRRAQDRTGNAENWRDLFKQLPFERAATAEEIGAAIAFLASERSGYTSGSVAVIDAGLSARAQSF